MLFLNYQKKYILPYWISDMIKHGIDLKAEIR